MEKNLETEIHANNVKKEFGGEELNPFKNVVDYFNKPEHLSEEVPTEISIINPWTKLFGYWRKQ